MWGLRIYTVHIKPDSKDPYQHPEFVQEGFNLYAFLFGGLWMLYNRLWWSALCIILFNAGLSEVALRYGFHPMSVLAIQLGFQALIGFHANDLLRVALKKRGYIVADIVTGDNKMRAEQRFFERHMHHIASTMLPVTT